MKKQKGFTPTPEYFEYQSAREQSKKQWVSIQHNRRSSTVWGFTLIELLVVIAIIGILATIVLVSLQETKTKSRIARAQSDIRSIRTALIMLEDNSVQWPGHWTVDLVDSGAGGNEIWDLGSTAGGISKTDGSFPNWRGPYIGGNLPKDPWDNDYFFDPDYDLNPSGPSQWAAVIGSFGPNGAGQNVFDSDNIIEILAVE